MAQELNFIEQAGVKYLLQNQYMSYDIERRAELMQTWMDAIRWWEDQYVKSILITGRYGTGEPFITDIAVKTSEEGIFKMPDFDEVYEVLNLASAEIQSMYKRVGIENSNVLRRINDLLNNNETSKSEASANG